MSFRTLDQLPQNPGVVLLRADLNVPFIDGVVTDTTRLDRIVPTLKALQAKGAKIAVLAHFGRPKGKTPSESLKPVAEKLAQVCGQKIAFINDCIGDTAKAGIAKLQPGEIAVLENVRFYPEEEKNDAAFTKQLAELGDVFVNDAFSASHRAHSSIAGLASHLPSYAGLLMSEELTALQNALEAPQKPVAAVIGGSKISSKLDLLQNLVRKVDYLILGGGMQNPFFVAKGIEVGQSLCEYDMIDAAKEIMQTAQKHGCEIVLAVDRIAVRDFGANAPFEVVASDKLPKDMEAVDIGPASVSQAEKILEQCRTVVWNGPMGRFEVKPFDAGTNGVALAVGRLTKSGKLLSVAGGGDTVFALENAGAADQFSYLSTAGGAFLEWLEGKDLPGVTALKKAA